MREEFFNKALDFAYYLVSEVNMKSSFFYQDMREVSSTLLLADILDKSQWGTHPLAQNRFPDPKKGKFCNNLLLLEIDKAWTSKTVTYRDVKYKTFEDWGSFATHLTDMLVFRQAFFDKYSYETLLNLDYNEGSLVEKFKDTEYWLAKEKISL